MSGHWRFCVAAFLFFAGLSISPASSNPLTDLLNSAPKEAAAPASAEAACVQQPGKSTAPGQHWVYRLDGHRKCWFQANEAQVSVRLIHRHTVKRAAVAPEENEAAPRKKMVLDARAQLLNSTPATAPQSVASAPEAVDANSCPLARRRRPRHPSLHSPPSIRPRQTTPRHARSMSRCFWRHRRLTRTWLTRLCHRQLRARLPSRTRTIGNRRQLGPGRC